MKITTQDAVQAVDALGELINERMPMQTAMQVRRLVRAVGPIVEDYNAERRKLIDAYARQNGSGPEVDERGNIVFADVDAFAAGHRELLAVEHDIDAGLNADALAESEIAISPRLLLGLGPLLVE